MTHIGWGFTYGGQAATVRGGHKVAYELFRSGENMDVLGREVTQNSLDAKNQNLPNNPPVKIVYKLEHISSDNDVLKSFKDDVLPGCLKFWREQKDEKNINMLEKMKTSLERSIIPVLLIRDYNTCGLCGVGDSLSSKNTWNGLLNFEGVSFKPNGKSLGSHGMGKNVPFMYSDYNMVFYNTYGIDEGRGFEGVSQLVNSYRIHERLNKEVMALDVIKYLNCIDELEGKPILPEDECTFALNPLFARDEYGTDVAIIGFKEYDGWARDLVTAIMKNFMLSFVDNKLEVVISDGVEDYTINNNTFEKLLYGKFKKDVMLNSTRQLFETITAPESNRKDYSVVEDNDLTIYAKYQEGYDPILYKLKGNGMLLSEKNAASLPNLSIAIVVNDTGESKLLNTLSLAEPPQHNEWSAKHVDHEINDYEIIVKRVKNYVAKINACRRDAISKFTIGSTSRSFDAGAGEFLPDTTSEVPVDGGNDDALRKDLELVGEECLDGAKLRNQQTVMMKTVDGSFAEGYVVDGFGIPAGEGKHHKRHRNHIKVVEIPKDDETVKQKKEKGVVPEKGQGAKAVIPKVIGYRMFLLAPKAHKYKLVVNTDQNYDCTRLRFLAGRDDTNKSDMLTIKNIKVNSNPLVNVDGQITGDINLKAGNNNIFVEFENSEIMAVIPMFVKD